MIHLAQHLKTVDVFRCLPEAALIKAAGAASYRRLKTDEIVCEQGEYWPNVVFVTGGKLRWSLLSLSGREQVLFHIEPGGLFWAHSLFDQEPMPGSLTAARPTVIYQWRGQDLAPILSQNPESLWELFRVQARAMRKAREIIYNLAFQPVAGRLAKLLLEQSQGQSEQPIERDLTLSDIASIVSSSQQVICRILYQFQADGILRVNRANITIQDFPALELVTQEK